MKETATTAMCEVHGYHAPRSHVQEHHHVWPQGLGGPTVAANLVWVCATGHNNIHRLLALMTAHGGDLPRSATQGFARREIELAAMGYRRWKTAAVDVP